MNYNNSGSSKVCSGGTENDSRVEYAKTTIEQMAAEAISEGHSGTIGIEISVKDGRLGKVKRLQIVFQSD